MKAAWYEKQGAARDVLTIGEMGDPQPLAGEVRIHVAFSGVNPGDVKKREDAFGVGMPYAGNAETRTLFQRHAFGELSHLFQRNHGELSRGSERSIGLSAITPDTPTDPFAGGPPSPTASMVPEPSLCGMTRG